MKPNQPPQFTPQEQSEMSALASAMIVSNYNAVWFQNQLEDILKGFDRKGLKAKSTDYQRGQLKIWFAQVFNINNRIMESLQQTATIESGDQINMLAEYAGQALICFLALPDDLKAKGMQSIIDLTEQHATRLQEGNKEAA
ncbi:MAG: hypothetical protein V4714_17680 [Bacteroidota bacterium]